MHNTGLRSTIYNAQNSQTLMVVGLDELLCRLSTPNSLATWKIEKQGKYELGCPVSDLFSKNLHLTRKLIKIVINLCQ